MSPTRTSDILRSLALSEGHPVVLNTLAQAMGSRAHGMALLLFALPETLPLPVPSTSAILGVPLVLVSAHLALFGESSSLPVRVQDLVLPAFVVRMLTHYAAPTIRAFERISRPRWTVLLASERAVGLLCLYLSVLLLLPLPFLNMAPAVCLVAVALGMVQRDGMMIAVGTAGTAALTLFLGLFADWFGELVRSIVGA